MSNKIIAIISKLKGNVLGIGLNEKMTEAIQNNDNITECNLLDCAVRSTGKSKRGKTIHIKKLRKYFKKKKVDYIVCNYEMIDKYMNTFVKNSIYINRQKIYFFGSVDKDLINKRYHRYQTTIKNAKDIIEIDTSLSRNYFWKDIGYRITDSVSSAIEFIGDILMN